VKESLLWAPAATAGRLGGRAAAENGLVARCSPKLDLPAPGENDAVLRLYQSLGHRRSDAIPAPRALG
jgi:hypothetical protein